MDNAVALVQAYLRINGYFTVAEYPVVEAVGGAGGHRSVTDLDILAFRFPLAGQHDSHAGDRRRIVEAEVITLDPVLGRDSELSDMLVGEVKEGRVRLNEAMRDPAVLRAALTRFGCCGVNEASEIVRALIRSGSATTATGHQIRMVAFGSTVSEVPTGYTAISLGHIVQFLRDYLRDNWGIVRNVQTKEPTLGLLLLLEKAIRGIETTD